MLEQSFHEYKIRNVRRKISRKEYQNFRLSFIKEPLNVLHLRCPRNNTIENKFVKKHYKINFCLRFLLSVVPLFYFFRFLFVQHKLCFFFYKYIYVLYRWILNSSLVFQCVSYFIVLFCFLGCTKTVNIIASPLLFRAWRCIVALLSIGMTTMDHVRILWSKITIDRFCDTMHVPNTHNRHQDWNWNPKAKQIAPHQCAIVFLRFYTIPMV